MKTLRRICTGAMGAVVGVTSMLVLPLAAASPAAAGGIGPADCTPEAGYTNCLRFAYSGDDQTFTVPTDVTAIKTILWGAGGGGRMPRPGNEGGGGGAGGYTTGTLAVSPGQSVTLSVGQGGGTQSQEATFGGGGAGGNAGYYWGSGSSGGGMSVVWGDPARTSPLLIAGGGGGAGGSSMYFGYSSYPQGGGGGGGAVGLNGGLGALESTRYGGGGTQEAGGDAASWLAPGCEDQATSGTQYAGGTGANSYYGPEGSAGGGGGGGYFGGGGGACSDNYNGPEDNGGGAGGGGSAFIATEGIADASTEAGQSGGYVWMQSQPGGGSQSLYNSGAGVGVGGSWNNGGNGEIVVEWVGAPAPDNATTSGTGTAPQSTTVSVPDGGSLHLLNSDGEPVNTLDVAGEGSYAIDGTTITFTPSARFSGDATPVSFRVTDGVGRHGDATYTPTVNKPAAPTPGPLTSNGTGTASQTTTVTVPDGGSVTLLDGTTATDTVPVEHEGTYTLDPQTGVITFTPVLGFSGDASGVTYQVTDDYDSTASSTYTPSVAKPAAPTVPDDPQAWVVFNHTDTLTVPIPAGGHIELLNESAPDTFVSEQGATWSLNANTGVITFTPAHDEAGSAGFAYYRVTDAYGQQTQGSYTAYLLPPAAPEPQPLTSVGNPNVAQIVHPLIPSAGSAQFIVDEMGDPFRVVVPEGVYTMDQSTYAITFTPMHGFVGTPSPVAYRVKDAYSQHANSTYQPQVVTAPVATPVNTSGKAGSVQHQPVPVPAGGSVMLLNDGSPVTSVWIPGQGTYSVNPQTGLLSFAAAAGFVGKAHSVLYRVTDGYGRHADAAYTATVLANGFATASAPSLVKLATSGTAVPVTCKVSAGTITRCDVTLTYRSGGRRTVVGTGSVVIRGTGGRQVVVPVKLNSVGHFIAGALGGVPASVSISVGQAGNPSRLPAATATRFVNASVQAPLAVYFDSSSALLRPGDVAYLNGLRAKLAGVRTITCTGNTDNTATWFSNWLLGTSRAASVCNYLTRGTLIRHVYATNGAGAPTASNNTAFGRQLNRRTDIRMDY